MRLVLSTILAVCLMIGQGEAACVHHPARSKAIYRQFLRLTGFLHGRPGYVVDHIVPLCFGGADSTANMQWQTLAASKAKDKTERAACATACHQHAGK